MGGKSKDTCDVVILAGKYCPMATQHQALSCDVFLLTLTFPAWISLSSETASHSDVATCFKSAEFGFLRTRTTR